jgi:hypothetical protein
MMAVSSYQPWYHSGVPTKRSLAARFWPKVAVGEPHECWPWTGARRPVKGEEYGQIYGYWNFATKKRVILSSHRVAYELGHGTIPAGMVVRHICDNPPCCNPTHLTLGTHADRLNGRAVLTAEKADQIRRLYATGAVTFRILAEWYGVSATQISRVVRNLAWT